MRWTNRRTGRGLALAAAGWAALAGLPGCRNDRSDKPPRQFFPDMDDAPKWKPQSRSLFYADGRTMRPTVPGTVPYGDRAAAPGGAGVVAANFERVRTLALQEDDAVFRGRDANRDYVKSIPVPVDMALLERGQNRFNIYCSVCHGFDGSGKGMAGQVWSYALPVFYTGKFLDPADPTALDGYIFNVARSGFYDITGAQKMPGYGHALDPYDTWAVVAYFRALQERTRVPLADVPDKAREALETQRPSAPPPGEPPAPATTGGQP